MSETVNTPALWLPDTHDNLYGYVVEQARPGDGAAISQIHGLAMISDYPHPQAHKPSAKSEQWKGRVTAANITRFVEESLWGRKGAPYWDGCIRGTLDENPYENIWVARSLDGTVKGFATTIFSRDGQRGELDAIYVHPAHRRQHVGSFLARTVLRFNEANGRITHASVTQWIPALAQFYIKHAGAVIVAPDLPITKAAPMLEYGIDLRQCGIVIFGECAWQAQPEERELQAAIVRKLYRPQDQT